MKNIFILLILSIIFSLIDSKAQTQNIILNKGWKFKAGDNLAWALPGFKDFNWDTVRISDKWENNGYQNYDGYGWYRIQVFIPSSLKNSSFLKDSVQFFIGKIDDNDQVYLNGKFIGQNNNCARTSDSLFRKGNGYYLPERKYFLSANDPIIKWDSMNTLAVRVFDQGGGGGMYHGTPNIEMVGISRYITFDKNSKDYVFDHKEMRKNILVHNTSIQKLSGDLNISLRLKESHTTTVVFNKTIDLASRTFKEIPLTIPVCHESACLEFSFKHTASQSIVKDSEFLPYILTPAPSPKPQINGPEVLGVGYNHPVLYKIPVSGVKPIIYEIENLPKELWLEKETGIIQGKLDKTGEYKLKIIASNKFGKAERTFTIKVGSGIALTPPMGWNSWNCWGQSISHEKVMQAAQSIIDKDLTDYGWSYINLDDGWQGERNLNGEFRSNIKFPDMKALIDSVHQFGLKVGVYSSPGPFTCGGFTGSYTHEVQDAQTYANWGVDFLKYDWCSYSSIAKDGSPFELKKPFLLMNEALKSVDRDIVYSICQYGMGDVWKWGKEVGGNLWRTTGDITDIWDVLREIGFSQTENTQFAQPGGWNDPDMFIVGKLGSSENLHQTRLTPDEQYTHVSLWCLLSAPLLMGCDISQLDTFTLNLLTNAEVLNLNQDTLGKQAYLISKKGNIQIWKKELSDGSKALGIFNLGDVDTNQEISLNKLGFNGKQSLRDLWRQKNLGKTDDYFKTFLPAHGVSLIKCSNITSFLN